MALTMPEDNTATVTVTETGEANTADFDEITFTEAGTYYFVITEDTASLPDGYRQGYTGETGEGGCRR